MNSTDAFFEAVKAKDVAAVEAMLKEEPDLVHARDRQGLSPLMTAVYHRADDIVDVLRASGASVDIHEASATGDLERLSALLASSDSKASGVNTHSADGSTPLHLACYFGHPEAVAMLLERGADVAAWSANQLHNQPLHAALAGSNPRRVVDRLLQAGVDVSAIAGGGYTPLHLAAARGDRQMVDLLIARGAESRPADKGESPADLAEERGFSEVATRLRAV